MGSLIVDEQMKDVLRRLDTLEADANLSLKVRNDVSVIKSWIRRAFSLDGPALVARGKRMPQTAAQFAAMGDLYERGLETRDKEISQLKVSNNRLKQDVEKWKARYTNAVSNYE